MKILTFENFKNQNINEKKKNIINSDAEFIKFVYDRLKLKFEDKFDSNKADKIINGLFDLVDGTDGNRDYAKIVGIINH